MNSIYMKLLIIGGTLAVGFAAARFTADNPVEQVAEEVLKEETGLNLDFSPEKGDKK